jgi:peptidyl-dipeptidase A
LLGACQSAQPPAPSDAAATKAKPGAADADKFVAELDVARRARYAEIAAAQWVSQTYINKDSQLIVAKTNERDLSETKAEIERAKGYEAAATAPATKRQITLLKLSPRCRRRRIPRRWPR